MTTTRAQRRRNLRKAGEAGILRLETKDRTGNSRWVTADILDQSENGVGVCLRAPVQPGTRITVRGRLNGDSGSGEQRAAVQYCCERADGTFRAGLEFISDEGGPAPDPDGMEAAAPPEALDHYELLELSPNASFETIGRVYRILAQRYHPDNVDTGNAELFLRLTNAYRVLSDPEQRAQYDATCVQTKKLQWKIFDPDQAPDGPETEKQKRRGILGLLYSKILHDPDQVGMTVLEFEEFLGCPREHLQAALWYLRGKGYVVRGDGGRYTLTVAGFEEYESHPLQPKKNNLLEAGQSWRAE